MGKPKENYGDFLGLYIAEKISDKDVIFANPKKFSVTDWWKPIYTTAGSILAHVNKKCTVWGSGIIKESQKVKPARFIAVRGPETRRVLISQGHDVPEVYGDPGLLLPMFYSSNVNKTHKLGIIPHYVDFEKIKKLYGDNRGIHVVDLMTNDVEKTTDEIVKCDRIISSSLHGLIVAHAYGIPAIWIQFSDKLFGDNIKFRDYFSSVGIKNYQIKPESDLLSDQEIKAYFESNVSLPAQDRVRDLQKDLLGCCPFRN